MVKTPQNMGMSTFSETDAPCGAQGLLDHHSTPLAGRGPVSRGGARRGRLPHLAGDTPVRLLRADLRLHQRVGHLGGLPGRPVRDPAGGVVRRSCQKPSTRRARERRTGRRSRPGRPDRPGDGGGGAGDGHPRDHRDRPGSGRGPRHRPGVRRGAARAGGRPRDPVRSVERADQGVDRRQRPGLDEPRLAAAAPEPRSGGGPRAAARRRPGRGPRAAGHLDLLRRRRRRGDAHPDPGQHQQRRQRGRSVDEPVAARGLALGGGVPGAADQHAVRRG